MSLRYHSPIIYNTDIRKSYNRLLNKKFDDKCLYINKYGIKCENKCLNKCMFILREYYCDYHIKNYIDDIIKLNTFISWFSLNDNYINNYLLNTYTLSQLEIEKIKYKNYMKKMYELLQQNNDYVLMTQPMINILYDFLFRYHQIGIYDTCVFKNNINTIKLYHSNFIINENKKYRKKCINILLSLTNEPDTTIGKVFILSKIADNNIFKIIESFI